MSALEGDREAVLKTLGDTIRALDAPDQWRILAATLNAIEKGGGDPRMGGDGLFGERNAVRWIATARQWRYAELR